MSLLSGCDYWENILGWDGVIGAKEKEIKVSEGTKPVFSWKDGSAGNVSVTRTDTLVTFRHLRLDDSTGAVIDTLEVTRNPIVWGYKAADKNGITQYNITSPVHFGEIPEGAIDLSDSLFALKELTVGLQYKVRLSSLCVWYGEQLFTP